MKRGGSGSDSCMGSLIDSQQHYWASQFQGIKIQQTALKILYSAWCIARRKIAILVVNAMKILLIFI